MTGVAAATRVAAPPLAPRVTVEGSLRSSPSCRAVGSIAPASKTRRGKMPTPTVASRRVRTAEGSVLRASIDPTAASSDGTGCSAGSLITAGDMWRLAQQKRSAAVALSRFAAMSVNFATFAQLSAAHTVEEAWREVEEAEEAARAFRAKQTAGQTPDV